MLKDSYFKIKDFFELNWNKIGLTCTLFLIVVSILFFAYSCNDITGGIIIDSCGVSAHLERFLIILLSPIFILSPLNRIANSDSQTYLIIVFMVLSVTILIISYYAFSCLFLHTISCFRALRKHQKVSKSSVLILVITSGLMLLSSGYILLGNASITNACDLSSIVIESPRGFTKVMASSVPYVLNETIVYEKTVELGYEKRPPRAISWNKAELVVIKGSYVKAKFLVIPDSGAYNVHYCPIFVEINGTVKNMDVYKWCYIDYTSGDIRNASKKLLIGSLLELEGHDLPYFEDQTLSEESRNEFQRMCGSSVFVSEPLYVIDVKYDMPSNELGCNIYEAHLFLDEKLSVLTGDMTYEECLD